MAEWCWQIREDSRISELVIHVWSDSLQDVWDESERVLKNNRELIDKIIKDSSGQMRPNHYHPHIEVNHPAFVEGSWSIRWIVNSYHLPTTSLNQPWKIDVNTKQPVVKAYRIK